MKWWETNEKNILPGEWVANSLEVYDLWTVFTKQIIQKMPKVDKGKNSQKIKSIKCLIEHLKMVNFLGNVSSEKHNIRIVITKVYY